MGTIDGKMQVMKTLAFFPYAKRAEATRNMLTALMDTLRAKGALTPAMEANLKASLDSVK
jgi:hypothetical protein